MFAPLIFDLLIRTAGAPLQSTQQVATLLSSYLGENAGCTSLVEKWRHRAELLQFVDLRSQFHPTKKKDSGPAFFRARYPETRAEVSLRCRREDRALRERRGVHAVDSGGQVALRLTLKGSSIRWRERIAEFSDQSVCHMPLRMTELRTSI